MDAGIPPPVFTGGIDDGTLPADAASGSGGGIVPGLPVLTDDGIPVLTELADEGMPTLALVPEPGLLLPDGGKLLNSGSLPAVLLAASSLMLVIPCPGKLLGRLAACELVELADGR